MGFSPTAHPQNKVCMLVLTNLAWGLGSVRSLR